MISKEPLVISNTHKKALSTSFNRKRNGLIFREGIRLLIINENLENYDEKIIMGVIVHELAHIYLHCKSNFDKKMSKKEIDKEANNLVMKEWGMAEELCMSSVALKNTG